MSSAPLTPPLSTGSLTSSHRRPTGTAQPNVGGLERAASGIGGGLLVLTGMDRGGLLGLGMMGLGAALVARGVTGDCGIYRSLGITTAGEHVESFKGVKFEAAVTINQPRAEVYRRYREFTRHPQFSETIKAVSERPSGTTQWSAEGPLGTALEWEAQIIAERPNEMCSWQSTADSSLRNAGSVRFEDAPNGRGTEMQLTMSFEPPLGPVGRGLGQALRALPSSWAQQELMRFKRWVESGQPAGA